MGNFEVRSENGHISVYRDGEFLFSADTISADTISEAHMELKTFDISAA